MSKETKALKAPNTPSVEAIMKLADIPIVYNKAPWIVYYYDDTYTAIRGNNEFNVTCQTVEQVQEYIPDFKN